MRTLIPYIAELIVGSKAIKQGDLRIDLLLKTFNLHLAFLIFMVIKTFIFWTALDLYVVLFFKLF
mgnify:CR=1 FL=1